LHVLLAAKSLADVGVVGTIMRWRNLPGRLGIHIWDKWYVIFSWSETDGVSSMKLQRR
jgi:hypothetical protein